MSNKPHHLISSKPKQSWWIRVHAFTSPPAWLITSEQQMA